MATTIWSGTIGFGLVTIPVRIQPATKPHDIHFHLLHRTCRTRIQLHNYCPYHKKNVERSELVRGYEYEKGKYVLIDDQELESIEPQSSSNLEIEQFVDVSEIDPIYFERSYYLVPGKGDRSKSFDLLVHAMKQKNRAAIGQLLMRDHEYLALIRPGMEGLILQLMFYEDEIRRNEESAPIGTKFSGKEVELAGSLIDNLTQKFDAGKFKSAYQERLEELIEAKTKGR